MAPPHSTSMYGAAVWHTSKGKTARSDPFLRVPKLPRAGRRGGASVPIHTGRGLGFTVGNGMDPQGPTEKAERMPPVSARQSATPGPLAAHGGAYHAASYWGRSGESGHRQGGAESMGGYRSDAPRWPTMRHYPTPYGRRMQNGPERRQYRPCRTPGLSNKPHRPIAPALRIFGRNPRKEPSDTGLILASKILDRLPPQKTECRIRPNRRVIFGQTSHQFPRPRPEIVSPLPVFPV